MGQSNFSLTSDDGLFGSGEMEGQAGSIGAVGEGDVGLTESVHQHSVKVGAQEG